jgi:hypothetical protein
MVSTIRIQSVLIGLLAVAALSAARPAAAQSALPLSGYMDFHFNKVTGEDPVIDFHRFVLLFTHSFTPRIRFVGELELEHAFVEGLEEAGELELEQAYLDFLLHRRFNIRAGMLLMPVGIINERHEPPVYHGVERPLVDTVIIPTTWFETGAGYGNSAGLALRAYVTAPLDAWFTAEGCAAASRDRTEHRPPGGDGPPGYIGVTGLTAGASFLTGRSDRVRPRLTPVSLGEADVRYSRDRLSCAGSSRGWPSATPTC